MTKDREAEVIEDMTLEEASDLVFEHFLGDENLAEYLIEHYGACPEFKATIAFHTMQSAMWFAEKELGGLIVQFAEDGMILDEILNGWEKSYPGASQAWRILQRNWWEP